MIDTQYPEERALNPLAIKYWQSKSGAIDSFATISCGTLAQIADSTGTHVALELENKRIRVAGTIAAQAEKAVEMLDNLEKSIVSVVFCCSLCPRFRTYA